MRIVFMGTPDFAVPSLERLVEAGYRPVAVVTGPDKRRGRGKDVTPTPVKKAARRLGIDRILQPETVKAPAFAAQVRELKPDVIVVVAFQILPPDVFNAARLGAFNLHGSLLPRFRGAAPINRAVMQGETETGVTTFFLKEAVDTGNVILRNSMPIGPEETAGEVHDRMMALGAEAVVETVRRIERGEADAQPQMDAAATSAPKIHHDDCRIAWDRSARTVHDQIRGLSPYPGAWTQHGDTTLKIYRTRLPETSTETSSKERRSPEPSAATDRDGFAPDGPFAPDGATPGEILRADGRLIVACGSGAVEILELQQQGRRRLPAPDFLNGYALEPGDRLG